MNVIKILYLLLACFLSSCGNKKTDDTPESTGLVKTVVSTVPEFNADSAYQFIAAQVDFGPRVPNTKEHRACGDYLIEQLKRFGAGLTVQEMNLSAYNGDQLHARNIIGSYNKESQKRILLFAHWDTRPYADEDADVSQHNIPIDGADDGASGVGVLLEVARQVQAKNPDVGIDIIFFDAEDYGPPAFLESEPSGDWWALGSQYWAKNPHIPNYKADYGILLDMVGTRNATFFKEGYSMQYAAPVVEQVWSTARNLGYGKYFIPETVGKITDDHIYVITGRGISCIDIINYDPESPHRFGSYWHTHNDTMDNIDLGTLKAVGQTVLEVIYKN